MQHDLSSFSSPFPIFTVKATEGELGLSAPGISAMSGAGLFSGGGNVMVAVYLRGKRPSV